jgi:hypothetical protein
MPSNKEEGSMSAEPAQSRVEILRTKGGIERLRDFWVSNRTHRDADIDFYLFLLDNLANVIRPHVIVLYRDGEPKTLVIGRLEITPLVTRIGYWRLWAPELQTITLAHGCLGEDLSEEGSALVVSSLIESLRAGEADLAWFPWLEVQSPLLSKIRSMSGFLHSDHFASSTIHHRRRLNDGRKSFVESLSSHERNNHRRRAKRLLADFHDAVRIDRIDSVEEIARLMQDVELIMTKSYQRRLGVGFVSSEKMRQRLEFEAKKGWLRGYILYVRNTPCAFWIGSMYHGTFHSEFLGYDPNYSKYGVGMYLVISALEELSKPCEGHAATHLDFGGGEGEWKAILSDQSELLTSVRIFAPTFRGLCLNVLRSTPAAIDLQTKMILNKLNLMKRVRRILRGNLARRGNPSD